jgi:hypothetical protein
MGKIIGNYRFDESFTSPGTDTKAFVGPEVGRGRILEVTSGAVADYTTANKTLVLGYRDAGGTDHYVVVEQGASIKSAQLQGRLFLLPTEKPIAIVVSPTASDVLYCSFHGILYEG